MRHSNIDVLYVPKGLKKNITRMLKSLSILGKMNTDDTNVFASSMIDKYENQPDSLHSMCLTDIASSYVAKKAGDVQIEPEEIENFTVPVSNMDDVENYLRILLLYMPWRKENEC